MRRRQEERERKKQRLSSQNPKLKWSKERENSGGQKVDTEAAIGRGKVRPKKRREAKRQRRVEREKVSQKKQLQRLMLAEDERKLQTKPA